MYHIYVPAFLSLTTILHTILWRTKQAIMHMTYTIIIYPARPPTHLPSNPTQTLAGPHNFWNRVSSWQVLRHSCRRSREETNCYHCPCQGLTWEESAYLRFQLTCFKLSWSASRWSGCNEIGCRGRKKEALWGMWERARRASRGQVN